MGAGSKGGKLTVRGKGFRTRRRRTKGERRENRGGEERARTRTADKGHIKTGIYILNKRGSQSDKEQGRRNERKRQTAREANRHKWLDREQDRLTGE